MTAEEIVDAARNAGFSSSEITHRLAAFKRLIQYSTSAEREKCTGTQEFVTLPRDVLERALAAMSLALSDVDWRKDSPTQPVIHKAYNATRAALEQPQGEQEPVPEHKLKDVRCKCCGYMTHYREHMGCIRAAQPKREPLTDEEIDKLCPQFDDPMRREMWIIGFKAANSIK